MFVALDVTQEADWEAAIPAIVDRFGGLDVLVNNAGVGIIEPLPEVTLESWRKSMSVNVDGVFLGTKHAMGAMRAGGSIINISSILGFTSIPGLSAYSATKGAVRLFSKGAALDGAKDERRIRVNSIHPGYIHTEMMEATCYPRLRQPGGGGWRALAKQHPIGRVGKPEDIANGVVFLASEESSFITGTELVIDGGYLAVGGYSVVP